MIDYDSNNKTSSFWDRGRGGAGSTGKSAKYLITEFSPKMTNQKETERARVMVNKKKYSSLLATPILYNPC